MTTLTAPDRTEAAEYYVTCPWGLVGPFVASLVLIGYVALTPSPSP